MFFLEKVGEELQKKPAKNIKIALAFFIFRLNLTKSQ